MTARATAGVLALIAASVAFIWAYHYFTQTHHFQAREIVVTGQQRLSRSQVLEIAAIEPHMNILAVNLTTTRKRLLANPWIADAAVSREIPSGLSIHIREEVPLAILEMGDGHGFLINIDGAVFEREDISNSAGLPRVAGLDHADLPVPGGPPTEAFDAVMDLLHLARETNSPLPLVDIQRLQMDPEIGAIVHLGEAGRAVKLGFGHYRDKCMALKHLTAQLRGDDRLSRYRVIDLFDVNRIVISLAPAVSSGLEPKEA